VILAIRPEPTDKERAAIEAALAATTERDAGARGPWWEAGLAENLDGTEPEAEAD
jgi:hypothetical protein